ncbi:MULTISPECIES: thioredoxin family protein [Pedobacter]|uniref:Thioredoxin family protein n=1 Tax=Pedobacter heparinus (strain ATCC 13125 / DSM 2366 / CIP 104194 / JCM 7457 / NBRC 12017 / NCIMB 9290 / NRRL B-14731 / HIM 762-3) TaxID=485917 RepID=C6XSC6_PEDHD|nr:MULTISPECIES: thioredoxin family protein [Pedobacter]ACU03471.1 hypothetical protein Phep_1255 [Pedobacter heparinus DSM 2366]MBB5439050.1 hypothetical protein [Pedobacter sp. AK017]
MHKILLLSLLLVKTSFSFAQIKYQKDFNSAQKKAAETNKPLFLNIGATTKVPGKSAIDNPDVIEFYNNNFVSYMVSLPNTEAVAFMKKYQLKMFPAYIFLDQKGQLIAKGAKSSNASKHYLELANQALTRLSSGSSLADYEEKYKNGNRNKDFLKEYISAKQQLGLFDNAKLIDEYVEYLTVGSFNDYNEVLFVLKAGPFAYGKAYRLAYTNRKIVDSIYKTLPLRERVDLNTRIINNTQNEAIATKNLTLANSLSNFVRGAYSKNYAAANKQSAYILLNYYKAVKDTNNYYRQAQYYYDQYYMRITADSINNLTKRLKGKRDSLMASFKERKIIADKQAPQTESTTYTYTSVGSSPDPAKSLAMILNNAAWDFYILGTGKTDYLSKALLWSKRAIELVPAAEYYDTMAHIFYRMQLYDEALINQHKAIEIAAKQKNAKERLARLRAAAEKMKQRQL